jgi:hypothetical protein
MANPLVFKRGRGALKDFNPIGPAARQPRIWHPSIAVSRGPPEKGKLRSCCGLLYLILVQYPMKYFGWIFVLLILVCCKSLWKRHRLAREQPQPLRRLKEGMKERKWQQGDISCRQCGEPRSSSAARYCFKCGAYYESNRR